MSILNERFWRRLGALIRKEFDQIRRDRRLAISLIVPPTLQLLLFGFALNSTVSNLQARRGGLTAIRPRAAI